MATKLTIHHTGSGKCSLTGKETDGLTVTFDDGTLTEKFLGWKGFQQILAMKAGETKKPNPPVAPAAPPVNGVVPAKV